MLEGLVEVTETPKERQRRQANEWRVRNIEKVRAKRRELYAKNPEKYRAQARAFGKTEKARDIRKRYHANHRTEIIAKNKERYRQAPEKILAYSTKWRAQNPEKALATAINSRLKCKYGLSIAAREQLLKSQDNRCAICRTDKPGNRGFFVVDHCHDTGKVRGMLCSRCNVGIGYFRNNPEFLQSAAGYLAAASSNTGD